MDKLISAEKLYEKIAELEEPARKRVLDTPTNSPVYMHYVTQLDERTAFKQMVFNEPAAFDRETVIEELRKLLGHAKSRRNQCEFASAEDFNYVGEEVAYKTALAIVEKGCVE